MVPQKLIIVIKTFADCFSRQEKIQCWFSARVSIDQGSGFPLIRRCSNYVDCSPSHDFSRCDSMHPRLHADWMGITFGKNDFFLPLESLWILFLQQLIPVSWYQIAQALRPLAVKMGIWSSIRTLARGYEMVIGLVVFTPVAFLAWFPFVSEFQTRMLFNQAFSRGLQISRILGGPKKDRSSSNKE